MAEHTDLTAQVVESVLASKGYAAISRDLVTRLAVDETQKRRTLKEAVRSVKSRLHQVANAYLPDTPRYADWLALLRQARASGDPNALRAACRRVMTFHASTRERLPILDAFYATTLAPCAPVQSVLDVACGLNPLCLPWMPLAPDAEYIACDVVQDEVAFVNAFLREAGIGGRAVVCDVLSALPDVRVDVALVLKTLPCLERIDKDAAPRLLDALQARFIVVSYPVSSLGGRAKGMPQNYEERFLALAGSRAWQVTTFRFATELAFLVQTG